MASQNVSDGGVGVPDPEDESLLGVAEPVCHDGHDAGPARGLKDSAGDLHAGERAAHCEFQLFPQGSSM